MDSAYECITRHGLSGTTISEICTKANVAKGTFYLYFNDKDDIARSLNRRIIQELIHDSYAEVLTNPRQELVDNLLVMANYLIDRFERDHELLKIIKHDFTWPISEGDLYNEKGQSIITGYLSIRSYSMQSHRPTSEVLSVIYCIVCMIINVSYDTIIEHNPASMKTMRPVLNNIIETLIPRIADSF